MVILVIPYGIIKKAVIFLREWKGVKAMTFALRVVSIKLFKKIFARNAFIRAGAMC